MRHVRWSLLLPIVIGGNLQLVLCVCDRRSIEFHPEKPQLLAVGLCSGEVRVFDLNNADEPLIAK